MSKKILGLAPMDGITNCAYRTITQELFVKNNTDANAELWMRTEFMNVEGFMREPGRLIHHMIKTDYEKHTIAQIYGSDHHDLVETAKFIDQAHPDFAGIELNIGCPSPKVMSCGGGAGMMRDRPRTIQIIKDIVATTHLPFSIKTRAGLTDDDKDAQKAFILEAAQYCSRIAIHGRTYKQSHGGPVDRQYIYDIKRQLGDTCIVIGNGGIKTYDDMLDRIGPLDGVMTAQAAIGRPWLFTNTTPTLSERYDLIVRHAQMMIILYEYYYTHLELGRKLPQPTYEWLTHEISSFAAEKYFSSQSSCDHTKTMIEYRKYLFNYISGLPGSRDLKVQLASTKDYTTTLGYVENFFSNLTV